MKLIKKIHSWPEEVRKLLAGILIVVVGLGFFNMWGSFISSRLVALGPASRQPAQQSPPPVSGVVRLPPSGGPSLPSQSAESELPSPAAGVAQTVLGLEKLFSQSKTTQTEKGAIRARAPFERMVLTGQAFFAAVGNAVSSGIEFLYLKMSRYVASSP